MSKKLPIIRESLECNYCDIGGLADGIDEGYDPPCHKYKENSKCRIIEGAKLDMDLSTLEGVGELIDRSIRRWWEQSILYHHSIRTKGVTKSEPKAAEWNPLMMMAKTRFALNIAIMKSNKPDKSEDDKASEELTDDLDKMHKELDDMHKDTDTNQD